MPTAWAPIVTRVWSKVASASFRPPPTVPDDPVARDAGAVEDQLTRRRTLDAELALLGPEREARVVLLHDERRDVVAARAVRVGHSQHRVVLRDPGVRDPRLLPREHPVVAVTHRPAPHRRGVGAGLTLGQPVRERRLPRRERRQVAALQLLAAGEDDRHRAELVHRRDQRGRRVSAGDLLDDDARRERVSTHPAVLLPHVRREEVTRHQRVVRLLRVAGLLVDRRRPRRDLVLRHRTDRLADRLVVLGEPVGVEVRVAAHALHVTDWYDGRPPRGRGAPATGTSAAVHEVPHAAVLLALDERRDDGLLEELDTGQVVRLLDEVRDGVRHPA